MGFAPGAGHSGWEDHFQADQYHFLHHQKFECNYGSPTTGFIDQYMGTFREKIGESTTYKGEWDDKNASLLGKSEAEVTVDTRPWSSQGYLALQTGDHLAFTATYAVLWAVG